MLLYQAAASAPWEIDPGHRRRDRFKNRQAQAAQTQACGDWENHKGR